MLQELTFVDSVLLITVFDLAAVRAKFSCKNTPKFTARPELGRTNPNVQLTTSATPFDQLASATRNRINTAAATNDDAADDSGGRKHDRSQTAAFARRWAGLAQTRRTGPVFKF